MAAAAKFGNQCLATSDRILRLCGARTQDNEY